MSIANLKIFVCSVALMLLSSTANADTFRANIQTTTPKGLSIYIQYELNYTVSADNAISGKLKNFTQKGPCIRADGADIIGKIEGDTLTFSTKVVLQGCEENKFVGKKQADGWAGTMRITGSEKEIVFIKK
jgi:hypothetical protein